MRSFRLPLILLVAGALAIGLLVLQLVRPSDLPNPAGGGTFVEGVAGAPRSINPLLCESNDADRDLCQLVFSGLTRLNEYGEPVPELAERWSITGAADGPVTYTFKLRPGLRWHDGNPITIDDVVFTAQQFQAPDFAGRADLGALWRTVKISRDDDSTVSFGLQSPLAAFLDYTAFGLLPRHVLSGTTGAALAASPFNLKPVGSGAWKLTAVSSAGTRISAVTLEPAFRDPNVLPRKPNFDRLVIRYYTSPQAAYEALRNGEVDAVGGLPPDLQRQLAGRTDVTLHTARMARSVSIFFNMRKDSGAIPLGEKAVRQALMAGLDRERMLREALAGQGVLADSMLLPDTWAYHGGVRRHPHDPARAIQLLRDAGFELRAIAPSPREVWQKDGEALSFTLITPDDPLRKAVAEAVAQQWRELGAVVAVQPVRNIARDFLSTRQFQAALVDLDMSGDPDLYSLWHRSQAASGQNYSGWEHKEMSEYLDQARLSQDRNRRALLYRQVQDALAEDLPALPLYYPVYRYAVANRVGNVQLPPLQNYSDRLRTVGDWAFVTRAPRR